MALTLKQAAESPELEAAWRHIQADFRVAFDRRNRYYARDFRFLELLRSGGSRRLIEDAEAEVDRLHGMLRSIDSIRRAALEASQPEFPDSTITAALIPASSLTEGSIAHG